MRDSESIIGTLFLSITVALIVLGVPLLIVICFQNNYEENCKKQKGILIKTQGDTICITKEQIKKIMEVGNE